MLEEEYIRYVFDHYGHLMSPQEHAAWKHHDVSWRLKVENSAIDESHPLIQKGWISRDPVVLNLLKDGYEAYRYNTVQRIIAENPGRIFYNECPKCNKLARTNKARQCRYCNHTWHDLFVGEFKIDTAFNVTGRGVHIIGQLTAGRVAVGMRTDLTVIGLTVRPIVSGIEYVDKIEEMVADLALGLFNLSEEDTKFLKAGAPFIKPIPIMK